MQPLVVTMLLAVTTFEYLTSELAFLPSVIVYVKELTALIATGVVLIYGASTRFRYVRGWYWILLGAFLLVAFFGVVLNGTEPGPVFAGIRNYFGALPFFFLPAVFRFSDEQIRRQLQLLLAVALIQVPIATYQRSTQIVAGLPGSGDEIMGTFTNGAVLSIYQIAAACMLLGFILVERRHRMAAVVLIAFILIPTMLNETKAVVLLLPLGFLFVAVFSGARGDRLRRLGGAVALVVAFFVVFVPVYNFYNQKETFQEFFTTPGRLEGYLDRNTEYGSDDDAGRKEALLVPLKGISASFDSLAFGFGIGNASESALGKEFTGRYFHLFQSFSITSASVLLLETGTLGLALFLMLIAAVFLDSKVVLEHDKSIMRCVATGWLGVTVVFGVSVFYKTVITFDGLYYPFWYLAGLIAAHRMKLVESSRQIGVPVRTIVHLPEAKPYRGARHR